MVKEKTEKDEIIEAYPNIGLLNGIHIKGEKDIEIRIGGFTVDGGIVLENPYGLVKEESKNLIGEVTYYNFVKSSKKMSEREKKVRENLQKRKSEEKKWKNNRIKELKEELARYDKEDKTQPQKKDKK